MDGGLAFMEDLVDYLKVIFYFPPSSAPSTTPSTTTAATDRLRISQIHLDEVLYVAELMWELSGSFHLWKRRRGQLMAAYLSVVLCFFQRLVDALIHPHIFTDSFSLNTAPSLSGAANLVPRSAVHGLQSQCLSIIRFILLTIHQATNAAAPFTTATATLSHSWHPTLTATNAAPTRPLLLFLPVLEIIPNTATFGILTSLLSHVRSLLTTSKKQTHLGHDASVLDPTLIRIVVEVAACISASQLAYAISDTTLEFRRREQISSECGGELDGVLASFEECLTVDLFPALRLFISKLKP